MTDYRAIVASIAGAGLAARGAVALEPPERIGSLADVVSVVLVGMTGEREWPAFAASPEAADGARDPMDRWSRRLLGALAERWGAKAIYPFEGPPYLPFLAWARRAEPLSPSPLGLLIHPDYGLSHSYRGALAFAYAIEAPPKPTTPSPCVICSGRPCLTACPVEAFDGERFDVARCAAHLDSGRGQPCRDNGCLARRACPVGGDFAQSDAQARFHMRAFMASRGLNP